MIVIRKLISCYTYIEKSPAFNKEEDHTDVPATYLLHKTAKSLIWKSCEESDLSKRPQLGFSHNDTLFVEKMEKKPEEP